MAEIEKRSDIKDAAEFWHSELRLASKTEEAWRDRAAKVVERFRDEKERTGKSFNILWANTEILKPATLANPPVPNVRRRYLDDDDIAREIAVVLERALSFVIDDAEFMAQVMSVRDDGLLVGRGLSRVKYEFDEVKLRPDPVRLPNAAGELVVVGYLLNGMPVEPDGEDADGAFIEVKENEKVTNEYVYWEDYRQSPARSWDKVRWVAFRHPMRREDLTDTFGAKGKDVPLTASVKEDADVKEVPDNFKRAIVWEIWDKDKSQRVWVAEGYDRVIETEDDPLTLEGFFPLPEPLVFLSTTGTMIPLIEYRQYQDQAVELDRITERIDNLIKMLKVAGLYDAVEKELVDLMDAADGELIPIDSAAAMRDKGGLANSIFFLPIEQIAKVLQGLILHREQLKREIFELTGISDLFRGATAASETATAQQIKNTFGSLRLQPKIKPMQRYIRDTLRITAEIMAEQFSPQTLSAMTGKEVTGEMVQIMRDDKLRSYRIDIETDSTVALDAQAEKQEAVEFIGAVTGYLEGAGKLAQNSPALLPLLGEMLNFAVRRFKAGRSLEETIEETMKQLQAQAAQAAQNPQPSPDQIKAQAAREKIEADKEIAQAKILGSNIDNLLDVAAR